MLKKVAGVMVGVPALAFGLVGSAYAALPTTVSDTATKASTDAQAVFDLVFPVIGTVIGLIVVIKLFKRFIAKI